MSSPDIFLSYNREDAARAKHFADGFAAEGFDVWWDVDLRSGEAYDQVTEEALANAKAVVVLWSPRSVVSRWVRAEATEAERNKTLLPAMIEPCKRPIMFELTQTAELSHWNGEAKDPAWRDFLTDVRKFVGKETPVIAPDPVAQGEPAAEAGGPVAAFLPFSVRTGDEELEMIAEDLTDEIASGVAHEKWLKVIGSGLMARYRGKQVDHRAVGKELGARYLLEGKLQRFGEKIRLSMQLVEAETGNILWSDKISAAAESLEQSDNELIVRAVGQLPETIFQCEMMRAINKRGDLSGWERFARGCFYQGRLSSQTVIKSEKEFRLALEASPDFGLAHGALANMGALSHFYPNASVQMDEAEIRHHLQRALELDGNDSFVLSIACYGSIALGDSDGAIRLARRAMTLVPNSWHAKSSLGNALFAGGELQEALECFAMEVRLAPENGLRYLSEAVTAAIHLLLDDPEAAVEAAGKSLAYHPSYTLALMVKALAEVRRGKSEQAQAAIRQLRASEPEMTIDHHVAVIMWWLHDKAAAQEWSATLRELWEAA